MKLDDSPRSIGGVTSRLGHPNLPQPKPERKCGMLALKSVKIQGDRVVPSSGGGTCGAAMTRATRPAKAMRRVVVSIFQAFVAQIELRCEMESL